MTALNSNGKTMRLHFEERIENYDVGELSKLYG